MTIAPNLRRLFSVVLFFVMHSACAAYESYYSMHQVGVTHSQAFSSVTLSAPTFFTRGFQSSYNYLDFDSATASQQAKTIACELGLVNNGQCLYSRDPNGYVNISVAKAAVPPPSTTFKIWLPKGTVALTSSFYMPQASASTIWARFGAPPTGAVSVDNSASLLDHLSLLVGGREVAVSNPIGGGSYGIGADASVDRRIAPLSEGGWLYFMYSGDIYQYTINVTAKAADFMAEYASMSFDAQGDPAGVGSGPVGNGTTGGSFTLASSTATVPAGGSLTLTPSAGTLLASCTASPAVVTFSVAATGAVATGTVISAISSNTPVTITCSSKDTPAKAATVSVTATPLAATGISLLTNSLTVGQSTSVIATPAGAVLSACSSSSSLATVSGATVSFAAGGIVTSDTPVTITCGSLTTALTLKPQCISVAGSTQIISVGATESVGSDGSLSLNITLKPDAIDQCKAASVWIAGKIPAGALLFAADTWFVRSPTDWITSYLIGFPITYSSSPYAFKKVTLPAASSAGEQFSVGIGQGKEFLTAIGAEVYLFYLTADGGYGSTGKRIWPPL